MEEAVEEAVENNEGMWSPRVQILSLTNFSYREI